MDQLRLIMRLCGKPTQEDIEKLDSEHARAFIIGLEDKPRADFKRFFKNSNPLVIDLLEKLLVIDPDKRPSADECAGVVKNVYTVCVSLAALFDFYKLRDVEFWRS